MGNRKREIQTARRLARIPESRMGSLMRLAADMTTRGQEFLDLALGVPDYPAVDFVKEAAQSAIASDANGYGDNRGSAKLRTALAAQFTAEQKLAVDPSQEVTVTAGASAALSSVFLALLNPGDQAIVLEPFYEYFAPQLSVVGAKPSYARLSYGDWRIDKKELKKALTKRCRALILNSPHNPTGRVFSLPELETVADFCRKHGLIAICDEAYSPFVYDVPHISLATLPGMKEQSVVIGGLSKVLNVAGWRIGSVIAPAKLTTSIRRINALSLGASTPLQEACASILDRYSVLMAESLSLHKTARDQLRLALTSAGFTVDQAEGTQSIFAGGRNFGFADSEDCCRHLLQQMNILAVPGNAFFRPGQASSYVRFCFARKLETIEKVVAKLRTVTAGAPAA